MVDENSNPAYRPKLQFDHGVEEYLSKAYGVKHFKKICQTLTCPSIYSCVRVNTLQTTRREAIRKLLEVLERDCNNLSCTMMNEELKDMPRPLCSREVLEQLEDADPGSANALPNLDSKLQEQEIVTALTTGIGFSQTDGNSRCGPCFEHPLLNNVVIVQGDGPHEVDYRAECGIMKEVIVSRKCAEAVLRGANVFVPGVLACSGHVEQGDIVAVSVALEHQDGNGNWVVGVTRGTVLCSEHGKSQLIDAERRDCYIGRGRAMLSRTGLFRERQGIAVEMVDRVYRLPPLHGVLKGEIFLQNLPSIVAAKVLDPKPGERILDMCAAPGGKSTAIAILMEDKGEVVAIDRSHNKVMGIISLAKELNLKCIRAYKLDALKAVQKEDSECNMKSLYSSATLPYTNSQEGETVELLLGSELLPTSVAGSIKRGLGESDYQGVETPCFQISPGVGVLESPEGKLPAKGQYRSNAQARKEARKMRNGPGRGQNSGERAEPIKGFPPNSFDRVLLDPPCSALGLRPRLFAGEETLEGLRGYGSYQRKMFDQAVQLVRPGGIIVYSTCTVNPGENEAVVRYALDTYSSLSLVPQDPRLGGSGLTGGLDVFDGMSYKEWLRDEEQNLVQRFDPSGPLDTIGFFIAKFKCGSKDETCQVV